MKHRVCYLTPVPADYPMVGVGIRAEQIMSALGSLDFVDLHVWHPEPAQHLTHAHRNTAAATCADLIVTGLAALTPYLPRSIPASTRRQILGWLHDLMPDLVLMTHPAFTPLLPTFVREGFSVVVDTYNVEQSVARQLVGLAKGPHEYARAACQYAVMRRMERALLPLAGSVWAASVDDADRFRALVRRRTPVAVVPNTVDVDRYATGGEPEPTALGFFGDFSFLPNEIAAERILCNILPAVREAVPAARLYLVGRNPSPRLSRLAAEVPGVVVTGTVEDTRPWMARCAVLLVPLEHGSGTRLKILEGLAMAKAIVSTPKGCEGLGVQDGIHLKIRDLQSFPAATSSMLLNAPDARAMGQRGRAFVAENYSLANLRRAIGELLEETLRAGSRHGSASKGAYRS